MLGAALAVVLSMCGNEALVLVRTPPDQLKSIAKPHRISIELKVPPTWKGHPILVQAWPFAPGTLDECHTDGGVAEPERYTLAGTRKLDLEIKDGRGRVIVVLAPGLKMLMVAFEPQDASVALYLESLKKKSG
jgi:hypothetical protein